MGEEMKVYRILVEEPDGKRPIGTPRHRWKDGIRMDVRDIVWEGEGGVDPVGSG
jgi:hypothetical protein